MAKQVLSGSQRWLCGLNFFVSDVRDGLGPFLGVFLMGGQAGIEPVLTHKPFGYVK